MLKNCTSSTQSSTQIWDTYATQNSTQICNTYFYTPLHRVQVCTYFYSKWTACISTQNLEALKAFFSVLDCTAIQWIQVKIKSWSILEEFQFLTCKSKFCWIIIKSKHPCPRRFGTILISFCLTQAPK